MHNLMSYIYAKNSANFTNEEDGIDVYIKYKGPRKYNIIVIISRCYNFIACYSF